MFQNFNIQNTQDSKSNYKLGKIMWRPFLKWQWLFLLSLYMCWGMGHTAYPCHLLALPLFLGFPQESHFWTVFSPAKSWVENGQDWKRLSANVIHHFSLLSKTHEGFTILAFYNVLGLLFHLSYTVQCHVRCNFEFL